MMPPPKPDPSAPSLSDRLDRLDVEALRASLQQQGFVRVPALFDITECATAWQACRGTIALDDPSRVADAGARNRASSVAARDLPDALPPAVADPTQALRILTAWLAHALEPLAALWRASNDMETSPASARAASQAAPPCPRGLRAQGLVAGQHAPLRRTDEQPGAWPLLASWLLSAPGRDFDGGEFVLTEQRPRMQSRCQVVPFDQGDLLLLAAGARPVRGTAGWYRTIVRHGISRLHRGERRSIDLLWPDSATVDRDAPGGATRDGATSGDTTTCKPPEATAPANNSLR